MAKRHSKGAHRVSHWQFEGALFVLHDQCQLEIELPGMYLDRAAIWLMFLHGLK